MQLTLLSIELSVYPNPTVNSLNFHLLGCETAYLVRISDISGKQVLTIETTNDQLNDVSSLKPGIYTYHTAIDRHVFVGKFIKQ